MIRVNPPVNMTVLEGAAYVGICPRKLRDLISHGCVKCTRIGTRIILRRESLDVLAQEGAP